MNDIEFKYKSQNSVRKPVVESDIEKKLTAPNFEGITLKDERLKTQYENMRNTYYNIPDESLLHGFRKRAGLPAPGESLNGWYGDDVFHTFGQYLSGFARMYAATGDSDILDKVRTLLKEWAKTIEEDGFFFYSNRFPKATHYIYDKMVGGLVDIYQYIGDIDALRCLSKITDWAMANLDRTNSYAKNSMHSPTEWYTLSENLYKAYALTGDEKYKKLGDEFLYNEYYEFFLKRDFGGMMKAGDESTTRRYHAYSHINSLNGAAMAYHLTGEEKFLYIIKSAYEILKDTQFFITGGYGPNETYMKPGQKSECLYSETHHFETPCGSWAGFKLSRYLMEFTGDAAYGDWAEKLLYNGIGAALPVKENGEVMYFSQYNINGAKKVTMSPWSCCTGTYPAAVTDYYNQIYYKSNDGIYVNLYVSSTIEGTKDGKYIKLLQQTKFPESDLSRFVLSLEQTDSLKLGFRVPDWCKDDMSVKVNGITVEGHIKDNWLTVERIWNDGDEIIVNLPMSIKVQHVENDGSYPVALTYGPVVLVSKQEEKPEITEMDIVNLPVLLVREENRSLSFKGRLQNGKKIEFVPFYSVGENENYFMFLDPVNNRIICDALEYGPYSDSWLRGDSRYVSTGYKAFFKATFKGTGIRWVGKQLENAGKASIYIDGKLVDTVDQYGPFDMVPWMWEKSGLEPGEHEIRVEVENEKNRDNKYRTAKNGYVINVMHLSVLE